MSEPQLKNKQDQMRETQEEEEEDEDLLRIKMIYGDSKPKKTLRSRVGRKHYHSGDWSSYRPKNLNIK
jgi:CRISPR/Cas system-associated protein Cas5 (RAMP superfamily)